MDSRDSSSDESAAVELFAQLRASLEEAPDVQPGTGFGAMPGLRVSNKIFAMLCRGELVVKLPRQRVDELVAAGTAERFDARRDGRRMKEWASVPVQYGEQWPALAAEALHFVRPQT